MDKLLIIPIVLLAILFLYRYVNGIMRGKAECHGDCSKCSKEKFDKVHNTNFTK